MAGRSEHHAAVILQEWLVFHIGGHGVSLLVLIGKTDIVAHSVALFIFFPNLSDNFPEQMFVFRRYGDNYLDASVSVAHISLSFNEMLCQRSPDFVFVAVECEHSLRLAAVAQTLLGQQFARGVFGIERGLSKDLLVVKGKFFQIVGKLAGCVICVVHTRENVLEHT